MLQLLLRDMNLLQEQPLESILHSETDANSWKREVERMTPQLKITIRQDAKVICLWYYFMRDTVRCSFDFVLFGG